MRTVLSQAFVVMVMWLTLITPSHAVNLVTNGGFETGDFSGWTLNGTPSTLFNVSTFQPHSGQYAMFIAEYEVDNDHISQIVSSVSGQQYALEFWLQNFGLGDDGLQVFWEGNLVLEQKPVLAPIDQWTKFTLPVAATTNGSELRLGGFDVPLAIYFDDISLTPIPEPSTLLLAMAGIAMTCARITAATKRS
jgi:hypothetical protein